MSTNEAICMWDTAHDDCSQCIDLLEEVTDQFLSYPAASIIGLNKPTAPEHWAAAWDTSLHSQITQDDILDLFTHPPCP